MRTKTSDYRDKGEGKRRNVKVKLKRDACHPFPLPDKRHGIIHHEFIHDQLVPEVSLLIDTQSLSCLSWARQRPKPVAQLEAQPGNIQQSHQLRHWHQHSTELLQHHQSQVQQYIPPSKHPRNVLQVSSTKCPALHSS